MDVWMYECMSVCMYGYIECKVSSSSWAFYTNKSWLYGCLLHLATPTQEDDPQQRLLIETIKNDRLREIERERKATAEKTILTAAKLIAPVIEASFALGFDWWVDK